MEYCDIFAAIQQFGCPIAGAIVHCQNIGRVLDHFVQNALDRGDLIVDRNSG
jgi:hypothetical protein